MKSFVATISLSLCILNLGDASEISNKALKTTRELKDQTNSKLDFLKKYAVDYVIELYEVLDGAQDQYQQQFNQEIQSTLAEIKSAVAQKKGIPNNECYEAAKSRFDKLNATSSKAVEDCSTSKKDGVDPDDAMDSLLNLLSHGKKLLGHVDKLEKEIEKSSENDLRSFEKKKIPGVRGSLAFYNFAVNIGMKRAGRAIDESAQHAKHCNVNGMADVHVIALIVRENAFRCIDQA